MLLIRKCCHCTRIDGNRFFIRINVHHSPRDNTLSEGITYSQESTSNEEERVVSKRYSTNCANISTQGNHKVQNNFDLPSKFLIQEFPSNKCTQDSCYSITQEKISDESNFHLRCQQSEYVW